MSTTVSVADMVVGEGDGFVDVEVRLNTASTSTVTVKYATQDVAPAYDGGYDYNAVSGTLNFAAGETTKTVRIHLAESASYDSGAMEHFRFNLSSPTNATLAKASAAITIVDNDTALAVGEQPGLYVRNVVVDEKAGSATFVVLLGGPKGVASDSEVTVNYAVTGGSATAGSDFNGNFDPLSGQLVFAPGEVVKTVTVAIIDDAVAEPGERFTLKLSNAVNASIADGQGAALIGASDGPTSAAPSLSVADRIVGEGAGYVDVVVTLSAPSRSNVSVGYATQDVAPAYDGGYDYNAVSGTLNFAAGETTKTVRIHLAESASYDSGAMEHFRFNLSSPTNATLAKASAAITIVDNDTALAVGEQPGLYVRNVVVDEKAGSATFVVLLGGPKGVASDSEVTVNYAVTGGSANAGSDYGTRLDALSGKLSFAPGEVVKTVTVAIIDDAVAEPGERFTLNLSNAVNASIADGQGTALIGASDGPTSAAPSLSVADRIVGEGAGYVDVVVTLSAPSRSNVSVGYATQDVAPAYDGGYDYNAVSGTLNFAAGETTKTVRIHLAESASYDSGAMEHFRFNLSSPTNATLAKASAAITIVDNDTALAVGELPGLYVRDVVVDEKAGSATFVVLLGGPTGVASDSEVTVNYAVAGGSAASGSDYGTRLDALSGKLSFAPGEVVKTVTVAITDDAIAENPERINFRLSNAINATVVDGNGVAVIGRSDTAASAAPSISVGDKIVSESDGYVDLAVTLSAPKTSAVSVKYATQDVAPAYDGGYDYHAVSGTLNFAAGETTKTVRVHLADSASYDTAGMQEHFRFNLSGATGATIATQSAAITIVDDDLAGVRVLSYGISDDTYRVTARSDVIVENASGGTDTVQSTINYTLGAQLENLTLLSAAIAGTGNNSNNILIGNAWANTLSGRSGNDTLDGRAGADRMVGDNGSDTYVVDHIGDVVVETNATASTGGTDSVYSSLGRYTLGANVENGRIMATGAANLIGNGLNNVLYAGAGNNVLHGGAGSDTVDYSYATSAVRVNLGVTIAQATAGSGSDTLISIEGLTGSRYNDLLIGNTVANVLNGHAGADRMFGGNGSDIYYVDHAGDVVTETNATASTGGTDSVYSSLGSYTLGVNVENGRIMATGSANLIGNGLNNVLYAGAGNNVLHGGAGSDTVDYSYATSAVRVNLGVTIAQATAGSGSDTLIAIERLTGSKYNDVLSGSTGNNKINGGAGNDILSGAAGLDIFRFSNALSATANVDTIKDFASVYDSIELENAVFTKLSVVGALAAANFKANTTGRATDSNDYVVYETDTGRLFYDADGSGAGVSVMIATLTGAPTLTHADIFVT